MAKKKIRLILADDHKMLRDGLKDVLEDHGAFQVVGEAADGAACAALAKELKPDVAIVDLKMPVMTGLDVVKALRADAPAVRVIIVSSFDDDRHVMEAYNAGAAAFLPKIAGAERLIACVLEVHEKGSAIPEEARTKLLGGVRQLDLGGAGDVLVTPLTRAELAVLDGVKNGLQNKEIAAGLKLSEKTVRNHLTAVFDKLGAKTRTEAVVLAIERGLLSGEADKP
jgi:DNA-binding NarL/FixJ family response regulator